MCIHSIRLLRFPLHISVSHSPHQEQLMCPLNITSYGYEDINYGFDSSNVNYKRYNSAYIGVKIYKNINIR